MVRPLSIAVVQMNSTADQSANIEKAEQLVMEAAQQGAQLVALPELFACLGTFPEILASAQSIPGPLSLRMGRLAKRWGIVLCAGSICEREADGKSYNSSVVYDADGQQIGKYRKIHLFNTNMPGKVQICEADYFTPGSIPCVVDTKYGRIGVVTCFDIRFPELFRELVGSDVDIVITPSAFTRVTGQDHWEVLLRARAIENQLFVVAPNQVGKHNPTLESYGHSMVVSPWGKVLAQADGVEDQILLATVDVDDVQAVRRRLPAVRNRRLPVNSGDF